MADKFFDVVAALTESFGQMIQQGAVGWRVGGAKVVNRLDYAARHQLGPNTIGHHLGKVQVLGGGDPCRERLTQVGIWGNLGSFAIEWGRLHQLAGDGMIHRTRGCNKYCFFAARDGCRNSNPFAANTTEVCRQAEEIGLAIHLKRMVMTFGAIEANSQEQLTSHGGEFFGLTTVAIEDC